MSLAPDLSTVDCPAIDRPEIDRLEIDRLEITGAIPRLTEATITALAEHLHAGEGAVAALVRDLLDDDVLAQGGASRSGEATYVTVDTAPA